RGYFDTSWQHPDSWSNVILQGPHLGVSTPMIKQPNPTMKHNQDWSEVDIEAMHEDFIPATAYFPNKKAENYGLSYGTWSTRTDERPSFAYFRGAWRSMLATTGFRSAYPAIIPPGPCHVDLVVTGGPISNNKEISGITFMTSILLDFYLRSSGASHLRSAQVNVLPFRLIEGTTEPLASTFLRLNCLTSAYAPLWEDITGTPWTVDTPIRKAWHRQQAQNEIDAMVALSLGVTADELCMIYRTQFPVMRKYDQQNLFDANGRLVPKEIVKAEEKAASGSKGTPESLSEAERTWTHPQSGVEYVFEYPFEPMDREAELRKAYAKYEAVLAESEK